MLHTISVHVLSSMQTILLLADEVIQVHDENEILLTLDGQEPGAPLRSRIQYLMDDVKKSERINQYRFIISDKELNTLASALAIVDWMFPEKSQDQHTTAVRFTVQDHLGVKNT